MVAGEQIDEVEVRRVGQRPAPEPPERKHDQLAVGNAAVGGDKFGDGGIGQDTQRCLRELGIAKRDR